MLPWVEKASLVHLAALQNGEPQKNIEAAVPSRPGSSGHTLSLIQKFASWASKFPRSSGDLKCYRKATVLLPAWIHVCHCDIQGASFQHRASRRGLKGTEVAQLRTALVQCPLSPQGPAARCPQQLLALLPLSYRDSELRWLQTSMKLKVTWVCRFGCQAEWTFRQISYVITLNCTCIELPLTA